MKNLRDRLEEKIGLIKNDLKTTIYLLDEKLESTRNKKFTKDKVDEMIEKRTSEYKRELDIEGNLFKMLSYIDIETLLTEDDVDYEIELIEEKYDIKIICKPIANNDIGIKPTYYFKLGE